MGYGRFMTFRNCIVCDNNENVENYCEQDGQLYVKCNTCGLVYVDAFASQSFMNKAYTGGGLKSLRRKIFGPIRRMRHIKDAKHFAQRATEIFDFIKKIYAAPVKGKKYIDIGCNKGFLLEQAVKNELDIYGVELVKEVMAPFKNSYPQWKEKIFHERFSNLASKFEDNYFDIISVIDVVEHFEDPASDLKHIHRVLKTEGLLFIQTPDVETKEAIEQKCAWGALKPLEHLHLFGQSNFYTFAKKLGFSEVVFYDSLEYGDGSFMAVLKK